MPAFRVTTIWLDRDQEVSAVAAVADDITVDWIRVTVSGGMDITGGDPQGTLIKMPVTTMLELFRAAGKVPGNDPWGPHAHVIYDSLSSVVYGLIEE